MSKLLPLKVTSIDAAAIRAAHALEHRSLLAEGAHQDLLERRAPPRPTRPGPRGRRPSPCRRPDPSSPCRGRGRRTDRSRERRDRARAARAARGWRRARRPPARGPCGGPPRGAARARGGGRGACRGDERQLAGVDRRRRERPRRRCAREPPASSRAARRARRRGPPGPAGARRERSAGRACRERTRADRPAVDGTSVQWMQKRRSPSGRPKGGIVAAASTPASLRPRRLDPRDAQPRPERVEVDVLAPDCPRWYTAETSRVPVASSAVAHEVRHPRDACSRRRRGRAPGASRRRATGRRWSPPDSHIGEQGEERAAPVGRVDVVAVLEVRRLPAADPRGISRTKCVQTAAGVIQPARRGGWARSPSRGPPRASAPRPRTTDMSGERARARPPSCRAGPTQASRSPNSSATDAPASENTRPKTTSPAPGTGTTNTVASTGKRPSRPAARRALCRTKSSAASSPIARGAPRETTSIDAPRTSSPPRRSPPKAV